MAQVVRHRLAQLWMGTHCGGKDRMDQGLQGQENHGQRLEQMGGEIDRWMIDALIVLQSDLAHLALPQLMLGVLL
jgi:hypothetical protein